VTTEEGEEAARRIHAIRYMECSAKTLEGVKQVFDEAVRAALTAKPAKAGKRDKGGKKGEKGGKGCCLVH